MIKRQKSLKILKIESGMTLVEILVVVSILSVVGILLYDLNLSILSSNLFIEVKNDLSMQGQQAVNQIKNRLISSRLLLADKYNKTTNTWTGLGSYYVQYLEINFPGTQLTQYPPLPTLVPPNDLYCPTGCPSGSDYYNIIARIESRTVGSQTQLVTELVPSDPNQPTTGLSASSIGNSILFIETLPSRRIRHTRTDNTIDDYWVDTYRLNYYYLHQKVGNQIAGKNYYVDLIHWESEEFVDYSQLLQIMTYLRRQGNTVTSITLQNMLNQLKTPSSSPFPAERGKLPLNYAWNVNNVDTINTTNASTIAASIRGNFYNLTYLTSFDPTDNNPNNDVPLTSVATNFMIPRRFDMQGTTQVKKEARNLLPGLDTGATQGRTYYTIAFNNDSGSNLGSSTLVPKNIPQLVPMRFNPYDTNDFAHPQFMGGFEIGVVSNTTAGYTVNLRLVLMADSGILHRMLSHETIVLVVTRS